MRYITEQEYQRLLELTNGREKHSTEIREDILNDQKIADDVKVEIYGKSMQTLIRKLINEEIKSVVNHIPVHVTDSSTQVPPPVRKNKSTQMNVISDISTNDLAFIQEFADGGRASAKLVMQVFKNNRNLMSWNKEGHCSFFNGPLDKDVDITSLLTFSFRYVNMAPPKGYQDFFKVCAYMRIPPHLFVPRTRALYLKYINDPDYDNVAATSLNRNTPLRNASSPLSRYTALRSEDRKHDTSI